MKCFCNVSGNRIDDVFKVIREHILNGGRALYIVYDPYEGYLNHVENNGIPHMRVSVLNEYGDKK